MKREGPKFYDGTIIFVLTQLISSLIAFILSYFVKGENPWNKYILSACFQLSLLLGVFLSIAITKRQTVDLDSYKRLFSFKEFIILMGIFICTYIAFLPMAKLLEELFVHWGYDMKIASGNAYLSTSDPGFLIVGILTAGLFGPFVEETMFRSGIANCFKKGGTALAIITSSLIFAFMHGTPVQFIFQLGIGIVGCSVYFITKSFWSTYFIHAASNSFLLIGAFIVNNANSQSSKTPAAEDQTYKFLEALGKSRIFVSFLISIIGIICLYFLIILLKNAHNERKYTSESLDKLNIDDQTYSVYKDETKSFSIFKNYRAKEFFKVNLTMNDYFALGLALFLVLIPWIVNLIKGFKK